MKSLTSLFLFLFLITVNLSAKYTIDRLEPPFWWAGMKNTNLQLMVYGQNISDLKPSVDHPGIVVKEIIQVQNPNYLFINLTINDEIEAGNFVIEFNSINRTEASYIYTLYEREYGSSERMGFTTYDVMYLITPDRFANGDPDNDNILGLYETADRTDPTGRHGGDIQGIFDHLDYIDEMGFTAIWLNPVLENNMKRTSYHGYATTDF